MVSYVGQATGTTSATLPAHQAGDLILIFAAREGSTTAPTNASGYNTIGTYLCNDISSLCSVRVSYKIAASSGETTGTWTNATALIALIYRPGAGEILGTSNFYFFPNNSDIAGDDIVYDNEGDGGIFLGSASSWLVALAAHTSTDTNIQNPPTGFTARSNLVNTMEVAAHDTNGPLGSTFLNAVSVTTGGTPDDWITVVVEIPVVEFSGTTQGISFSSLCDNAFPGIGFIGAYTSTDVTSNSLTVPHQEGDLLVGFAFRDGSTTNPLVPGGWTTITNTLDGTTCSATVAYKFATGSSETTGAWTNATEIIIHVYRRAKFNGTPNFNTNAASSTTVNYPALTLRDSSRSWVAGFAGHRSTNTNLQNAPSGMFNRSTFVDSAELSGHDTNVAPGGNWPSTNVSVGGTSSGWTSIVIELEHQESIAGSSSLILDLPNALLSRDGLYLVSATVITASSGTMPAHSVGDLIIGFAFRDGSTINPSVPAGWTIITNNVDGTFCSAAFAYKVAQSDAETTGTWTNATALIIQVFRNGWLPVSINYANSAAASTTVTYPALAALNAAGTSWVAGFAGHRSTDTNLQNAPSGMINEATGVNGSNEGAAHSSGGPLAAWAGNNVSVSGTSSGWISTTIEIRQIDRMKISPTYLLFTVPNAIIDGGGANIGPIINTYYRRLRE